MNTEAPIKRNPLIVPLSREHHHSLLLCWKIKTGLAKGVAPDRIRKYAYWFYKNHLEPHFKLEETLLFPILGEDHKMVIEAKAEHRLLSTLFADKDNIEASLKKIETVLQKHIRFEERVLFTEIEYKGTDEQMQVLLQIHSEKKFTENEEDKFWESHES